MRMRERLINLKSVGSIILSSRMIINYGHLHGLVE